MFWKLLVRQGKGPEVDAPPATAPPLTPATPHKSDPQECAIFFRTTADGNVFLPLLPKHATDFTLPVNPPSYLILWFRAMPQARQCHPIVLEGRCARSSDP